jgi:tripartite ATP-independent transporter DctM subunit
MDGLWIALLIALAIVGTPLFAIFGAASMLLFGSLPDTSITGTANDVFSEKFADSPLLVTIPLFTFAGYVLAESGTPDRLVKAARAWFGWMPGGLAMVCLVASAFFTTFTGGSGITIVAIGGLLYPALISDKYKEGFSLGLVTTGGSLGLLFPPSVPMIIYGVVAGIMIEKLFVAGLIPGIITVAMLALYGSITGIKQKMVRTKFNLAQALKALWEVKWEALLPIALLAGIYSGLARLHEAAAFTAIYTLVIELWVYRDISFRRDLPRIIRESMTLVGAILVILAAAIGFTAFLIQARVPMLILDAMEGFITSKVMFLVALNLFLLVVGMLMDIFSAIVVVVPLIVPIALKFGVDPYHLAIVFLLNLEIGYLTPPVGLNLFISSFRFNKPVTQLYRYVLPYIGLLGIALIIVTYVPTLSTTLTKLVQAEAIDLGEPTETEMEGGEALDLDSLEVDEEGVDGSVEEGGGGEPLDLDTVEGEQDEGAGP